MAEFFSNCWEWITAHADVIAGILTPTNLILLITTVIQIVRQKRALNANSSATKTLTDSLAETAKLKSEISALKGEIADIRALFSGISDGLGGLKDDATQSLTKLNCILDVQQQAYGVSLAKTKTLDAINGIIANGKFAETRSRQAIADEVAELRAKLETLTDAAKESEAKVKSIAGVADKPDEAQEECRYD